MLNSVVMEVVKSTGSLEYYCLFCQLDCILICIEHVVLLYYDDIYCQYYYCFMYTYAVQMIKSGYLFNSLYNSSCVSFHIPCYGIYRLV